MTVFELHLQLNQRLQEVASYKRDKFKPEELDMALNKAMFRLLETGVNSKFEDTEINLSQVKALIQKNKVSEVIIPQAGDPLYEDNTLMGYTTLSPDLYWIINNRVETIQNPLDLSTAPILATTTLSEYVAVIPFPALDTPPYFDNVSVVASVGGSLYTSPSQIAAGFTSANSKYVVVNNILESFYKKISTLKVYWERYRDTYYKDSFIFVSTIPIGTITLTSGNQTSVVLSTQTSYTIYDRSLIATLPAKTVAISSTKITQENDLYNTLSQNVFYSPRQTEPIVDHLQDYLVFYREISFIITRSYIDYIRKPRTISLLLNQSCELADSAHPKLIDLAVELLRLDTKDPAYQQTVADTQLRTN